MLINKLIFSLYLVRESSAKSFPSCFPPPLVHLSVHVSVQGKKKTTLPSSRSPLQSSVATVSLTSSLMSSFCFEVPLFKSFLNPTGRVCLAIVIAIGNLGKKPISTPLQSCWRSLIPCEAALEEESCGVSAGHVPKLWLQGMGFMRDLQNRLYKSQP